ncbi:MAG: recombination protein RecR [Candidatus Sungbacteria bacterium]|nr:recombination protein RecR [Candidatus Sungbacteria bacterium]
MYPKPIQTLIELFAKLPGVGPRQAARMAFFVLREPPLYALALVDALRAVKAAVSSCNECFRATETAESGLCDFCSSPSRDGSQICIVEKEVDISTFEKSGYYKGLYHVLGGTFSALEPDSPKRLRLMELYSRIKRISEAQPLEVIIATGQTSEGDTTALYIEQMLEPLQKAHQTLSISRLGRGLSMGTELEYADEVTLQHALINRKQNNR